MSKRADKLLAIVAGAALLVLIGGIAGAIAGWRWGIFAATAAFCILWLVGVTEEDRWAGHTRRRPRSRRYHASRGRNGAHGPPRRDRGAI